MSDTITLAVPSKGRLMEDALAAFATGGMSITKAGNQRGYRGEISGIAGVEVTFVSASEIAKLLRSGEVHLGVTGEDLIREAMPDADSQVDLVRKLGFGSADVVVAVPDFWIDVTTMADLEEAAVLFRRQRGSRMRVATKYTSLTRRFFAGERFGSDSSSPFAVTMYRIVESLGATEGAPAAGTAELIVDITSTGSTLRANGLRILDDGVILRSEANLVLSKVAPWSPTQTAACQDLLKRLPTP